MTTRIWIIAAAALSLPIAACQSVDVDVGKPRYATRMEDLPQGGQGTGWEEAAENAPRGSVRVVPAKPRYASRREDLPGGRADAGPEAAAAERAARPASTVRAPVSSDADPVIVREAIQVDELPPPVDAATPERGLADTPARQPEPRAPRPQTRPESTNTDVEQVEPATVPGRVERGRGEDIRPGGYQYVIQSGDTIAGIGRRFGVHAQALIELNGLQPHGAITAGQTLALPGSAREGGSDPYATGPTPAGMRPRTGTSAAADMESGPRPTRPAPVPAVAAPPPSMPAAQGRGRFIWPVRGDILLRFGAMGTSLRNDGVNIGAPDGTPVKAAADGEVVYAGSVIAAFGNMVLIKHADGWVTAYGYMSRIDVHMRDAVKQGQVIGAVGSSGGMPAPQLHFEIRYAPNPREKAAPVDPLPILR